MKSTKEKTIILPLDVAQSMYREGGTGRWFAIGCYSEEELNKPEVAKRWKNIPGS